MPRGKPRTVLFLGGESARKAVAYFTKSANQLGLPFTAEIIDESRTVTDGDLTGAAAVVATGESLASDVRKRLAGLGEAIPVRILPSDAVETAVEDLIAVLLGGQPAAAVPTAPAPPPPAAPRKPAAVVKVGRETAGRKGKGVTTVWELPLDEAGMKELATLLKQKCGTGGTVKDDRIEIQGDHRDRITAELEKLGYRVKRAGG